MLIVDDEVTTGQTAANLTEVLTAAENDVLPALGSGMRAVWLRRGPWGLLQRLPPCTAAVPQARALAELPDLLADFEV